MIAVLGVGVIWVIWVGSHSRLGGVAKLDPSTDGRCSGSGSRCRDRCTGTALRDNSGRNLLMCPLPLAAVVETLASSIGEVCCPDEEEDEERDEDACDYGGGVLVGGCAAQRIGIGG